MRALSLLFALLGGLAGCQTARGAYQDAMAAETAGDYDRATHLYAQALQRDAALPNVRGRLAVASREAVRRHLAAAAAAPPVEAADHWLRAEAVVAEAATAGVDAERPATFAPDRDRALDDAAVALLADAAAVLDAAAYARAVERLDALGRYRPAPARQADAQAMRVEAHLRWAEAELLDGRYRKALDRTAAAAAAGALTDDVDLLRQRILDRGTRYVAVLPVAPDATGDYPPAWLASLDDAVDEALVAPRTLFLTFADPRDVRDVLREGAAPSALPARAAWLARRLEADLAVLVRLAPPAETVEAVERERVRARLRGGARDTTSYVRETEERRATATATVSVFHPDRREPVCAETVQATGTERQRRGRFAGDWRTLDLGATERALFDDATPERASRRALDALRGTLADHVGRIATRCLEREVP